MFRNFVNNQLKQIVSTKQSRNLYSTYKCCKCGILHSNFKTNLIKHNLSLALTNNVRFYTLFTNHTLRTIYANKYDSSTILIKRVSFSSQKYLENKFIPNSETKLAELEVKSILSQFPQPKNVLHTFFDNVSLELKSHSYKIKPQYKLTAQKKNDKKPRQWICTYNITWPESVKFQSTATTKQEASYTAAAKALLYLQKSGKLLENGLPIIYDKEDFNKITKKAHYSLILDEAVEEKLNKISEIYTNNVLPIIPKYTAENEIVSLLEESDAGTETNILQDWTRQQVKVDSNYLNKLRAKESVKLPIQDHRNEFENFLDTHRVIIVRGEPGCGKSTRIPQYILEHWVNKMGFEPAKIVITQPRRIAAISLAERVAQERNEQVGDIVGYHVRLKSSFNPATGKMLYCTTGILLRQLQADSRLSECTHVILDEAHERDVNTDLLMNLLRRALDLNPKLKLIIMSATIDVQLFQNYFNNAPVMNIPGFTYPVKKNFLEDINLNLYRTREMCNNPSPFIIPEDVVDVIKWINISKPEGAILCFLPGWDEISKVRHLLSQTLDLNSNLILALHSKLSDSDQRRIFSSPPPGVRKIILATNIAETSVTIDDVVYVIDSGIHKENRFDAEKGIMCIDNHWISQSSMNQRKGRAGRVRPGESYHLYPKVKYGSMLQYSVPEILRVSLTKIVLDAKVYSGNMDAIEFFTHLPCPPEDVAVVKATQELQNLELLDRNENVTPLGKVISEFQLPPKLSKAMVNSVIYKCVTPLVDIATIFSSDIAMFYTALTDKNNIKLTKERTRKGSDHIALMLLFEQWANLMDNEEFNEAAEFCSNYKLVPYKLSTLKKLEDIHYEYLEKYLKNVIDLSDEYSDNEELIKGVLLSGVGTVLNHRKWDIVKGRLKRNSVFITNGGHKATITSESVNNRKEDYTSPFLLYINETRSIIRRTILIRETSLVNPLTLLLFKNSPLILEELRYKIDVNIEDPVLICLKGTKIKMLCNREQAMSILNSKKAIKAMETYFIYQLCEGSETNSNILNKWDNMLHILSEALKT